MTTTGFRSRACVVGWVLAAAAVVPLGGCTKNQTRRAREVLYKANTPERAEITVGGVAVQKASLAPGEATAVSADLSNRSQMGTGPLTVFLEGYLDPNDPRTKVRLGTARIEEGLGPGGTRRLTLDVQAPSTPGTYTGWFGFQGSQEVRRAEGSAGPITIEVR